METTRYATKARNIRNIYDSPLATKITFDEGEIRLRVFNDKLNIFSESYPTQEKGKTLYWISKQIPLGYTPQSFLKSAREEIINRVGETNNKYLPFDALDMINSINRRFRANEEIPLDKVDCSSIERALDSKIPTYA
jgi:hypothetical protein